MISFVRKNTVVFLLLSITLGLAPFIPEPHLWGKLKWVFGGANGMGLSDWFDVFLHGTPWLFLIASLLFRIFDTRRD